MSKPIVLVDGSNVAHSTEGEKAQLANILAVREKMTEYIDNGAQLGWLLDPFERKVYVYRPQTAVEVLDDPQTVSGAPLLRGLVLNLQAIWD